MPKKSTKLNKEETEKLSFAIDETKTFLNISQFYYEIYPTNKTLLTAVWVRAALKRTQNSSTRLLDVTQSIPTDCRDIKEYFLTRVSQLILKQK